MFNSDQPIRTFEDDLLNRSAFSKELAKAITLYTKKDNFVVGLCGPWGCGKTSVLNLVINEIEEITRNIDDEEKPIIIRFNPWNYSDSTQLIGQFFETLSGTLKNQNLGNNLSKVGEALDKYSELVEYTQYIPIVGDYLKPLKKVLESTGEIIGEAAEKEKSIDIQKERVIKLLEKQRRKFIVVIDDIDRLNNTQIRAIFQLVNSVAGFPNMIYVLAFDKEVVARALQQEQGCDGEIYLEKIIQVPFDVPDVNIDLLNKVFIDRYATIINVEEGITDFDESYWGYIYGKCIRPFLNNIRDVNRILNAFEFKYNLMKSETNPIDLLIITVLSISAREIYDWIRINGLFLTGTIQTSKGVSTVEQKNKSEEYKKQFSVVYSNNSQLMLEILQVIFPKFAWETGAFICSDDSDDKLRRKKRIASSDKFKNYFCLSLEEIPVKQHEITESIRNYDEEQFMLFMQGLLKRDSLYYYLQELQARVEEIPEDRQIMIVKALIEISWDSSLRNSKKGLTYISRRTFLTIVEKILIKRDKSQNVKLIIDIIDNSNTNTIAIIVDLIGDIERAFDDERGQLFKDNQFIDKEKVKLVEQKFLDNVALKIENIFNINNIYNDMNIVYLWEDLDKQSFDNHIKKLIKDDINVPKLLLLYANKWNSSRGESGWYFNENAYADYISFEEAYDVVLRIKNNRFDELNDQEKRITVAFALWYESKGENTAGGFYKVDLEAVMKYLPEWE